MIERHAVWNQTATAGRLVAALLLCGINAAAQSKPAAAAAQSKVATKLPAQADSMARYSHCAMSDGLDVVETTPLPPGVRTRTVQTDHGATNIALRAGRRVMFAYPGEDFYANVKVERLSAATYATDKQTLIDAFDHTLAREPGNVRNYALKSHMHGLPIFGLDREKMEGGVLGMYLFFDDVRHDAITVYLLNQEPAKHFHTMDEYGVLRDRFLESYTMCLGTQEEVSK